MHPHEDHQVSNVTISALLLLATACGFGLGYLVFRLGSDHVDPWRIQKKIMRISGQPTPDAVQANKFTVTYIALILEELSETIEPVRQALTRGCGLAPLVDRVTTVSWSEHTPGIRAVYKTLQQLQSDLKTSSVHLRMLAEKVPTSFCVPMTRIEAREFADGVTDMAVVVSGLTIAGGVPGGPCYEEVGFSNLSKADPTTGLILKDASGKWIKGPNYRAPDIEAVLDACEAIV